MKKKRGFTLIELLVAILVVALVGVVSFVIIPNILNDVDKKKNKLNLNTIKSSAGLYVGEYSDEILWMTEYDGTNTNVNETGNEYACTTIKMLQNKGYIKDEFNFSDSSVDIDVNENTSIKILRDKYKLVVKDEIFLNSIDCTEYDTTILEPVFSVSGIMGKNDWYIKDLKVNIKPIGKDNIAIGKSGVKAIQYVVKDNGKNIDKPKTEMNLYGKFNSDGLDISIDKNSSNLMVCASIINGLDVYSEEQCSPVYKLDNTSPNYNIKSSDGIESGNWHMNNFDLSFEINSYVSPITYYIDSVDNPVTERDKLSISEETNLSSYYFKTCNEAGTCSEVEEYIVKLDKTKPVLNLVKSTDAYVKKLNLTGTATDSGSGIVKYKFSEDSAYKDSDWTIVDANNLENTISKEITKNGKYYLWAVDSVGNYNSQVIDVTNIDNEGPTYVSGGIVSEGSVSDAFFEDVSKPITVYYIIKEKQEDPLVTEFTSTTKMFSTKCATTYYAYAKAVDSLGNYTIKYLGYKTTDSCCSEGIYGSKYCNNKGWYEQSRYNECLGKNEIKTLTDACQTSLFDCGSWGECKSTGKKSRTCYYYDGGVKKSKKDSKSCTYVEPEDDDDDDDSSSGGNNNSEPTCDRICQMNQNQNAWHETGDPAIQEELHNKNEELCPGCTFDEEEGKWYEADGSEVPIYGDDKK